MPVLSARCFFFFFFSRVPSHISHTARAQFSSHVRVISSSSMSPCIPSGGQMEQRPLVMCSAVWSAPQSQQSLVDSPQRSMFAPNLPTPVRSLFSRVQTRRDRPTPCPLFDGVGMYIHVQFRCGGCPRLSPPCLCSVFHLLLWRGRGH